MADRGISEFWQSHPRSATVAGGVILAGCIVVTGNLIDGRSPVDGIIWATLFLVCPLLVAVIVVRRWSRRTPPPEHRPIGIGWDSSEMQERIEHPDPH